MATKQIEVLHKLHARTQDKTLAWKNTPIKGLFIVSFPGYVITLEGPRDEYRILVHHVPYRAREFARDDPEYAPLAERLYKLVKDHNMDSKIQESICNIIKALG